MANNGAAPLRIDGLTILRAIAVIRFPHRQNIPTEPMRVTADYADKTDWNTNEREPFG